MAKRKKKTEFLRLSFVRIRPGIWCAELDGHYRVIVNKKTPPGWVAKVVTPKNEIVKIGDRSLVAIGSDPINTIGELFSYPQVWHDGRKCWITPDEHYSAPDYKWFWDKESSPFPNLGTLALTISYEFAAKQNALREQKLHELDTARKLNQQIKEEFDEFKAQLSKKQQKRQTNFAEKPFAGLCRHNLPLEECPKCASWGSNYEVREHD